jgi:hypothetical protein
MVAGAACVLCQQISFTDASQTDTYMQQRLLTVYEQCGELSMAEYLD